MTADFRNYLNADSFVRITGKTRSGIFTELIEHAVKRRDVEAEDVFSAIMAREKMMSTAVGGGLAIPHGRLKNFGDPLILVGVCPDGVSDYAGLDGVPVKLALLVLVDYCDAELHLSLLRSIAHELLAAPEKITAIAGLRDPAHMMALLTDKM